MSLSALLIAVSLLPVAVAMGGLQVLHGEFAVPSIDNLAENQPNVVLNGDTLAGTARRHRLRLTVLSSLLISLGVAYLVMLCFIVLRSRKANHEHGVQSRRLAEGGDEECPASEVVQAARNLCRRLWLPHLVALKGDRSALVVASWSTTSADSLETAVIAVPRTRRRIHVEYTLVDPAKWAGAWADDERAHLPLWCRAGAICASSAGGWTDKGPRLDDGASGLLGLLAKISRCPMGDTGVYVEGYGAEMGISAVVHVIGQLESRRVFQKQPQAVGQERLEYCVVSGCAQAAQPEATRYSRHSCPIFGIVPYQTRPRMQRVCVVEQTEFRYGVACVACIVLRVLYFTLAVDWFLLAALIKVLKGISSHSSYRLLRERENLLGRLALKLRVMRDEVSIKVGATTPSIYGGLRLLNRDQCKDTGTTGGGEDRE
ncbi:hypothetical protein EMWEY_00020290 [Eimeria maxima]|uniref:Uncharacterized protein n=1 Tax=Eimeria maxima TaxID=5804 RepID=U6M9L5_EIMMA|nr:hypothetical protein EMWEY_00020290 [Eimeria maxima]CDJ59169.1 hypothetical protein EMWEY_00020290 [Eimeria maxima]